MKRIEAISWFLLSAGCVAGLLDADLRRKSAGAARKDRAFPRLAWRARPRASRPIKRASARLRSPARAVTVLR